MFKIRTLTITAFITILCLSGCKDKLNSNIPSVSFRTYIDLSRPQYASLLAEGQSMVLPKNEYGQEAGYAGVIVIKSSFSDQGYYAFDRCCTHHPEERHQISANGALAICPVDSSVFVLINGSGIPTTGPATLPLRPYRVSLSGNSLTIYN